MKNWLIKTNEKYDSVKEPKRFLLFFIPMLLCIITLNLGCLIANAFLVKISAFVMIIGVLWRMSPKFFLDKKN